MRLRAAMPVEEMRVGMTETEGLWNSHVKMKPIKLEVMFGTNDKTAVTVERSRAYVHP